MALLAGSAACGDAVDPVDSTTTRADLLALPVQNTVPQPTSVSFWVSNRRVVARTLRHADDFNTPFLELRFPQGALASLDGRTLTIDDSVLVTVQPTPGYYGFTLAPAGLAFPVSGTPTVEFFFGLYGDFSVGDGAVAYPDRAAFAAALEIWEETGVDRWRVARGSALSGVDAISSAVDAPGRFLVAAPR